MPDSGKKLIFVVDDDIHIREAMAEAFADEGFNVVMAVDGQEALDKLASLSKLPDAIITDLLMPRLDGWELRHRLHIEKRLSSIPVIILSSALDLRSWPDGETPAGEFRKPPVLETLLGLVNDLVINEDKTQAVTKVVVKQL